MRTIVAISFWAYIEDREEKWQQGFAKWTTWRGSRNICGQVSWKYIM